MIDDARRNDSRSSHRESRVTIFAISGKFYHYLNEFQRSCSWLLGRKLPGAKKWRVITGIKTMFELEKRGSLPMRNDCTCRTLAAALFCLFHDCKRVSLRVFLSKVQDIPSVHHSIRMVRATSWQR